MKIIHSIKYKIFFSILCLLIFFFVLVWVTINETYAKSFWTSEINYNVTSTDKIKTEIENIATSAKQTALFLSKNSKVDTLFNQRSKSNNANVNYIDSFLQDFSASQPYINSILIYGVNGQFCSTNSIANTKSMSTYYQNQINENQSDESFWTGEHTIVQRYPKSTSDVFSYVYPISNPAQNSEKAYIIINISYDYIENEFTDFAIEENEKAFICNSTGKIIFNYPYSTSFEPVVEQCPELLENDTCVLNKTIFGVDSAVVVREPNDLNWKIIRVIPTESITVQAQKNNAYFKIFLICITIIAFLISMLVAQKITEPIHALNNACKSVEKGNFCYTLNVRGKDEMSQLCNTFNLMVNKINLYLKKELESQKQKNEMEFKILQEQINPHFLYNTLDSIKWLAAMQNMNNIVEMSTALINLLKYNLSSHNSLTSLEDEINSVKNYIVIQKFRYLDTFEFTTSLSRDSLNCRILRFILQPLVENSIIHGFRDVEKNYKIQAVSYLKDDTLHIKVIDNGCGMDMEKVNEINTGLRDDKCFNNIGISNIQKRIQLYYGGNYGLTYKSFPDGETIAEITLPINTSDN